jgi:hypothetical protein
MDEDEVIREIHERFRRSSQSLNEIQRRLWAATEAIKIGRGGITLVSKALRMSRNTIRRGIQDIATGQANLESSMSSRIRRPGGGRRSR